jgi:hypothetical protein
MFPIHALPNGSLRGPDLAIVMALSGREWCTHRVRAAESHG